MFLSFPFYSYIFQDLKCSLPVGLGLSETKITAHGFDGAKEGVVEAGQFPSKGKWIFLYFLIKNHILTWSETQSSVAALSSLDEWTHLRFALLITSLSFFCSWVVKVENICYTCSICQETVGNYLELNWFALIGREGLGHLELVSG